jgi:hypothetical protein
MSLRTLCIESLLEVPQRGLVVHEYGSEKKLGEQRGSRVVKAMEDVDVYMRRWDSQ